MRRVFWKREIEAVFERGGLRKCKEVLALNTSGFKKFELRGLGLWSFGAFFSPGLSADTCRLRHLSARVS